MIVSETLFQYDYRLPSGKWKSSHAKAIAEMDEKQDVRMRIESDAGHDYNSDHIEPIWEWGDHQLDWMIEDFLEWVVDYEMEKALNL